MSLAVPISALRISHFSGLSAGQDNIRVGLAKAPWFGLNIPPDQLD